jgi:hypothetical protein
MSNRVVFSVNAVFSERDYNRYGIERFINNGFDVSVWDFHIITGTGKDKSSSRFILNSRMRIEYICFDSISEFKELIKKSSIDIFITTYKITYGTFFIFNALDKVSTFHVATGAYTLNSLPTCRLEKKRGRVKHTLTGLFDIFFEKILITKYFSRVIRYSRANLFLKSGGEKVQVAGPILKDSTMIKTIPSLDYNTFIGSTYVECTNSDSIVFIDQGLPFHPDWSSLNLSVGLESKAYYKNLSLIFDKVEKLYKKPVVIAGHPKVESILDNNLWESRKVIYGCSNELIRNSYFVLTHYSTAVALAALYEKRIGFISLNSFKAAGLSNIIKCFAEQYKVTPFSETTLIEELKCHISSKEHSRKYVNDFVCPDVLSGSHGWQLAIDYMKQYHGQN